jgi:hypothetical protein
VSKSVSVVGSNEPGKGLTLDMGNISRACRQCCQGVNFVDSELITMLGTGQKRSQDWQGSLLWLSLLQARRYRALSDSEG